MLRPVIVLVAFFVLSSADVFAQNCAGLPSFNDHPFQIAPGASFSEGAKSFGGSFSAGSDRLFGGLGVAATSFSDFDSTGTTVVGSVGSNVPLDQKKRVSFCPGVSVAYTTGIEVLNADLSVLGLRLGGRAGVKVRDENDLAIIPTFGLEVARDRATAKAGSFEDKSTDTYGVATLGLGFVISQWVGIVPSVGIPFGLDDSNAEFSITVAFQLGRQ